MASKKDLALNFAYGFHNRFYATPSTEQAFEAGFEEGMALAISLLNGQDADLRLVQWNKAGLTPTGRDWANWLHGLKL